MRAIYYRMRKNNQIIESHLFMVGAVKSQNFDKILVNNLINEINKEATNIDIIINDVKDEIDENVIKFDTSYIHSTTTSLALGILTILTILIGGYNFSKTLTNPIISLVDFTKKVSQNDMDSRIKLNTHDELSILAESFNHMLANLKSTTISRDYFDNILKSMFNALIVTDENGIIQSVNDSTLKLLEYSKGDLVGQDVDILFSELPNQNQKFLTYVDQLIDDKNIQSKEITCLSKSGQSVPVLFSCSIMSKEAGRIKALVIVMHDLTEKKSIERKIEQIRKERIIAINDAQEEEKLRIAIELHDGLGQLLTAISYAIQNYFIDQFKSDKEYHKNLDQLQILIDNAIAESKVISHDLIPFVLKDFGLKVAIKKLIDQVSSRTKINFSFNVFNFDYRIENKLEKALYRII